MDNDYNNIILDANPLISADEASTKRAPFHPLDQRDGKGREGGRDRKLDDSLEYTSRDTYLRDAVYIYPCIYDNIHVYMDIQRYLKVSTCQ